MEWLKRHKTFAVIAAAVTVPLLTFSAIVVMSDRESRSGDWEYRLRNLNITKPSGSFQLWVNTFPEGALVLIDGVPSGTTPLAVGFLPAGDHSLEFRLRRFIDIDTVVSLDGESVALHPFIFERTVTLESVPPDAEISINDRETEHRTPYRFDWPVTDTFNVEYSMIGLEPVSLSAIDLLTETQIAPMGDYWGVMRDTAAPEDRFTGYFQKKITVNTVPSSAEIVHSHSDSIIGQSGDPIRLPCGTWELTLRKSGFNERKVRIEVAPDSITSYFFELTRNLRIRAFAANGPPDIDIEAEIVKIDRGIAVSFIDERTPAVLTLPGAEQRIHFEADGYADTSIIISADQTALNIGMRKIAESMPPEVEAVYEGEPGDKARIEFYVYDRKSRAALVGAEVVARIESENRTVLLGTTDSTGLLALDLRPDKYEFRFFASGYRRATEKHRVASGGNRKFDVSMRRK